MKKEDARGRRRRKGWEDVEEAGRGRWGGRGGANGRGRGGGGAGRHEDDDAPYELQGLMSLMSPGV